MTVTDPREVVQEVTNAITMLTVSMEKKTTSVLAMTTTLEMDSPVQVVKKTRLAKTGIKAAAR